MKKIVSCCLKNVVIPLYIRTAATAYHVNRQSVGPMDQIKSPGRGYGVVLRNILLIANYKKSMRSYTQAENHLYIEYYSR